MRVHGNLLSLVSSLDVRSHILSRALLVNSNFQKTNKQLPSMVSFRATLLALASAMVVAADYYIDPNSVDMLTRSMFQPECCAM